MKSCVLSLLIFLVPTVVRAEDRIRIEEVGLQGFLTPSFPSPVRIHIPALLQAQTIQLEFTVDTGISMRENRPLRTDHFRMPVRVGSDTPLEIEVPLPLGGGDASKLQVSAKDSRGQMIGQATTALGPIKPGLPVAIYCDDDRNCREAQRQITLIPNTEEYQNQINQVEFVLLKEPRKDWWGYTGARALVLAGSVSSMEPGERMAIEKFLRRGGRLILLEKEVSDPTFLSPYRQGTPGPSPILVGMGRLYRVASLETNDLARLFPPYGPKRLLNVLGESSSILPATQVLGLVEISFHFPQLAWLVTWIAAYILTVGFINFTILRRVRRLEWGWITVCLVSLVFSAGLYLFNSTRRPKTFTLDSASIYRMDGHSPIAVSDFAYRISSPRRGQVTLSINDDVLPEEWANYERPGADIATNMTGGSGIHQGLEARIGDPYEIKVAMLKWSYKDFSFVGVREFPGTVHWISGMRLKNETGQKFREAVYLDRKSNKEYVIGALRQGEEIDLAQMTSKPIGTKNAGKPSMASRQGGSWAEGEADLTPFSKEELSHWNSLSAEVNRVFIGANDAPITSAKLSVPNSARQTITVTIVNLDQP